MYKYNIKIIWIDSKSKQIINKYFNVFTVYVEQYATESKWVNRQLITASIMAKLSEYKTVHDLNGKWAATQ